MPPRQSHFGSAFVTLLSGVGVAAGWAWVCRPNLVRTFMSTSADSRDVATLGVMVLGALIVLTAFAGAGGMILAALSKFAGLLILLAFGFGCVVAYQKFRENHAPPALDQRHVDSMAAIFAVEPAPPPADAPGPWWQEPAEP